MVGLLGELYGQTLTPSQTGGMVSAIADGFVAQLVARLIKFIPGFGSVISASWTALYVGMRRLIVSKIEFDRNSS
jgi:uncharacterized protein (DUF697 family)